MPRDPCKYCGSEHVVAVLDKRIDQPHKAGNKYKRYCLSCDKWQPAISAEAFEAAEDPHVLPLDGDSSDPESFVPLGDYEGADDDVNQFVCPMPDCEIEHTGYPDECDCGAVYSWDEAEKQEAEA